LSGIYLHIKLGGREHVYQKTQVARQKGQLSLGSIGNKVRDKYNKTERKQKGQNLPVL